MRFKNKLCKEIIRCIKEKNLYPKFKENLYTFISNLKTQKNIVIIDEKLILSQFPYHNPLFLALQVNEHSNYYNSPILLELHKKNFDENIKVFECFLEKNKIKTIFFDRIDVKFIEHEMCIKPNKIKNTTSKEFLYNNMPPTGFILNSFLWENTKEGTFFWEKIHKQWQDTYKKHIEKKYNFKMN